eukprot:CAMPEP_0178751372 /NCGR_PEP_ID=MMETSP0744-20121128/10493_1 /TAXON_ID=913974 /ORGANISM="Nitzschia punctata, Strain CCMP561" /LENGTH=59 /DNA_ID=CAMNT_0020405017 /DNA_START=142 /DNA_END=321 /DNA_ORIENTATION=+
MPGTESHQGCDDDKKLIDFGNGGGSVSSPEALTPPLDSDGEDPKDEEEDSDATLLLTLV